MVRRNPVQQIGQARRRLPISERRGARVARPAIIPPPVGGWNARDSLNEMRPEDAVMLKNWFPRQSDVISRPGFTLQCDTTLSGSSVKQLIPFEYGAYSALLACVGGDIVDVTTSTPSILGTGFLSDYWSFDYLIGYCLMVNGADVVKSYNGVALGSPAFTGVTLSLLSHVSVFKSRAYFVQKNTQIMWYGGTGAVSGALSSFDFSTVASIRGNLLFTTHLKGDGGDGGQDDVFLAVFSGGDILAYTGSDPGDATNWNLLGHYHVGRPLSRLSYTMADDDVYMATNSGYVKLSEISKFGNTAPDKMLVSNKIQQAVLDDIRSAGESDDWRMFIYPKGQMFIVTSPLANTARRYHVQNINTKAWCEFGDFLAYSWATRAGVCYFGGSGGKVYKFDNGATDDNGTTIRCDCQQAWSSLGAPGSNKQVQLVKPFFYGSVEPSVSINIGADYAPVTLASFSVGGDTDLTAVWDVAVWDVDTWSFGELTFANWYSRNGIGESIGLRIAVDAPSDRVRWNQTLVLYTVGGFL